MYNTSINLTVSVTEKYVHYGQVNKVVQHEQTKQYEHGLS